ncbi:aspartic proteinase nepenthesin-1-like [Phragmites australis]|uniref:aspartic proteinase nepenthesin-1-like n=1 Tax=Phragmites australis TaxID=29695 RepID=UPI002D7A374A|nr:aspartic proteinase nepenthesin-1-like [Phragmites australis]
MARPLLWLALLCVSLSSFAACGLRLELTHVDAKDNCTVEERLHRATERTHRRLASMGGVIAPVRWAETQYIAEYHIGDPPQRAEAIVDTGSDLIWTQCVTCRPKCFSQNLPFYNYSRSLTVQAVSCNDTICAVNSETQCTRDGKACAVLVSYGAGDIAGVLGTEVFTFRSEKVRLAFGCIIATDIAQGSLDGASGIIGLGRGALSLVSQLGDTKFSYCLTPYLRDTVNPSHLYVGASAELSGNVPVTSVPFVKNPKEDPFNTFYYLPLVGMTVGNAKLAIPAEAFDLRQVAPGVWAGGVLIDSGSPFTSLVDVAYQALGAELARQLGASLVTPPAKVLDLCVARGNVSLVPPLVLHFGGGGDVVVPPENYWGPVDRATECMLVFNAATRTNATLPMNETTIIGNYMQQNMHLLYDLGQGVLSFQPADCSSM